MSFKITLISTVFNVKFFYEPLGLCSLISYLEENGYEVDVIHPAVYGDDIQKTALKALEKHSDFIGISVVSEEQSDDALSLAKQLRKNGFNKHICIGGHHPTIEYEKYLSDNSPVDSVIVGEGEVCILNLVKSLEQNSPFINIDGLSTRNENDQIIFNSRVRRVENLDELPFVSRKILYQYIEAGYNLDSLRINILASRGCIGNCIFCSHHGFAKRHDGQIYRQRSAENVVKEVSELVEKFSITKFVFRDETFVDRGEKGINWVNSFKEKLISRGLKIEFELQTRIDTLTHNIVKELKECGLREILIGIESFVTEDLVFYNKEIDLEKIEKVLEVLEQNGFSGEVDAPYRIRFGFIPFHPFTTLKSLKSQCERCKKYRIPYKKFAYRLKVHNGTELQKMLRKMNLLKDDNTYNFVNPEIDTIYNNFKQLILDFRKYRESIRAIEKAFSNLDKQYDSSLRDFRIWIDNKFYDFVEDMIDYIENSKGKELNVDTVYEKYNKDINIKIKEMGVDSKIEHEEQRLIAYNAPASLMNDSELYNHLH